MPQKRRSSVSPATARRARHDAAAGSKRSATALGRVYGDASAGSKRSATAPELVTRTEAARILGASLATVRRLEHVELATHVGADGVHRFRRLDVEGLASSRGALSRVTTSRDPGERAARAWELYSQGRDVREVVIALRMHPHEARELLSSFAGVDYVVLPPGIVTELASLGFGDAASGRVSAASVAAAARRLRDAARPKARAVPSPPAAA